MRMDLADYLYDQSCDNLPQHSTLGLIGPQRVTRRHQAMPTTIVKTIGFMHHFLSYLKLNFLMCRVERQYHRDNDHWSSF